MNFRKSVKICCPQLVMSDLHKVIYFQIAFYHCERSKGRGRQRLGTCGGISEDDLLWFCPSTHMNVIVRIEVSVSLVDLPTRVIIQELVLGILFEVVFPSIADRPAKNCGSIW